MSGPSNKRHFENVHAEDAISNLPDAILSHILSLVPTKTAVKTSILSKRWKYVWTKVPTLDFTEMPLLGLPRSLTGLQRSYFKSFVDKVLLHNDVSYLRRVCFDLFCDEDDDFDVKSWLNAVTRRGVREIDIKLWGKTWQEAPLLLPRQMISAEMLVVLKLEGLVSINGSMPLHLPNLETVHLVDFQFPGDEFMKRLSSSCPVLKELCIARCYGIINKLHVESLTLKSLEIRDVAHYSLLPRGCIVIQTPGLRYLALQVELASFDIGELSSLVEANLDLFYGDYEHAFQLLRKVSGVEILRYITDECEVLYKCELPILRSLTSLKVGFEDCICTCKLLECAPTLKSLVFENLDYADDNPFEYESELKCLSCLESLEFHCISEENENMIKWAAYFLKSSLVLKKMKIHLDDVVDPEYATDVYQKLLVLPRSSTNCQIIVVCANET